MVTQEKLIERFTYDPESGGFLRRYWQNGTRKCASVGWVERSGHLRAQIDGIAYAVHRLVWLYVHGEWPNGHLDHINGDPADNRIANLRIATPEINAQNQRRAHRQSTTGLLGVSVHGHRYRAVLKVGGRHCHIGTFDAPEQAHRAYVEAKRVLHPGFAG